MTPLELAQSLGVIHLIDILRPTIHVPVPLGTLEILQRQFHELINHDMGDDFRVEEWCLPQIEILLELEPRHWTWFPIDFSQIPRTEVSTPSLFTSRVGSRWR
jgi:hypothetical protein